MNLRPAFPFLPAAVLVLGMAIPARSQNTLMFPNMTCCTPQMEATGILLGETYGDVLTFTLVISKTPTDRSIELRSASLARYDFIPANVLRRLEELAPR